MPRKIVYNIDLLNSIIDKDGAVLLYNYEKVNKRTTIIFRCHCGEEYNKNCLNLITKTGAFCRTCTMKRATTKLLNTISNNKKPICNIDSLHETITRDNATLLGNYDNITQHILVYFKCKCGEDSSKNCLQLIKVSGAFCKKCTREKWTSNTKKTNIERYGVECTVHAKNTKETIIKNNLNKYGVENIFQSPEIRKKIKQTIIEKYGVEHVAQSPEIQEKRKQTCIEKYGVENPMLNNEIKEK